MSLTQSFIHFRDNPFILTAVLADGNQRNTQDRASLYRRVSICLKNDKLEDHT